MSFSFLRPLGYVVLPLLLCTGCAASDDEVASASSEAAAIVSQPICLALGGITNVDVLVIDRSASTEGVVREASGWWWRTRLLGIEAVWRTWSITESSSGAGGFRVKATSEEGTLTIDVVGDLSAGHMGSSSIEATTVDGTARFVARSGVERVVALPRGGVCSP